MREGVTNGVTEDDIADDRDGGAARWPSYAYRPSLIGPLWTFTLRDDGLAWQAGRRQGLWPYATVARVRLSFRPRSMQHQFFRAVLNNRGGERLVIASATWQGIALLQPQNDAYRAFIQALHARLADCPEAAFEAGLSRPAYTIGLGMLAVLALAMMGLFGRALAEGVYAGALFIVGFAGLFVWQFGGFMWRNQPRAYRAGDIPANLLPGAGRRS